MLYAFGLGLGKPKKKKKNSVSWSDKLLLSTCPIQNDMVVPEWAECLLSVSFYVWCNPEALRITFLTLLVCRGVGGHTVWENGLRSATL